MMTKQTLKERKNEITTIIIIILRVKKKKRKKLHNSKELIKFLLYKEHKSFYNHSI